jgi:hypothetical protein
LEKSIINQNVAGSSPALGAKNHIHLCQAISAKDMVIKKYEIRYLNNSGI